MKEEVPTLSPSRILYEEVLTPEDSSHVIGVNAIVALTQLARRKRLIALVTCASMMTGAVCSLLLPVRYTATTKIMPPQAPQSSASLLMNQMANSGSGALAVAAGAGLGLKSPNEIYLGMLNSRPVADAIIQQFGLSSLYHARDLTAARKKLATYTSVALEKSGFLSVSVTDRDKTRAAAIANAYTEQLRVLTKDLAVTEASQRRLFYDEQLKHAKEDLVAAELAFQQVQEKKGLVQLDSQAKALITGLAGLQAEVAAKDVELQALRSYSTELNPDVQLAENQLASLRAETLRVERQGHSTGSFDVGLKDVTGAGAEYLRAEHELQYRQIMFDLLLKQYDAARLDEVKDAAVIQVLEPAIPPDEKSSPHRGSLIILFAAMGFLGISLCVLVFDFVERNSQFAGPLADLKAAFVLK